MRECVSLLCYSNGDLVPVELHYVRTEGTAGLFCSLGYDVSAVVDYPPLAVSLDCAVMTCSFDKIRLGEDRTVGIVVRVFGPLELSQIIR